MRHREVSRLEGFSDAVFGFALTLLVVSLEIPQDFAQLRVQMAGFVPFALMFAMVCWIWYEHNVFFLRYVLQGPWTVFLNIVLLFVVLFYVYPLKFLTISIVGGLLGLAGRPTIADGEWAELMLLYSSGVLVIFTVFVLLHWHAWRQRHALGLDELERLQLKSGATGHALSAGIAVVSLVLLAMPIGSMWSGLVYCLMGPVHGWNGYRFGRASDRLRARTSAPAEQLHRAEEAHH